MGIIARGIERHLNQSDSSESYAMNYGKVSNQTNSQVRELSSGGNKKKKKADKTIKTFSKNSEELFFVVKVKVKNCN